MSGSVNKVILVGNLGKDPEIRTKQSGEEMATFSVATSQSWRDKNTGERREKTEWHRVVVFNERICTFVKTYVKKGHKVYIEGELSTRKWSGDDGVDKYTTEVVLSQFRGVLESLSGKRDDEPPPNMGDEDGGGSAQPQRQSTVDDDEIPF